MPAKDVRDMTIRELNELAAQVRSLPVGSKKYRQAADRMSSATWALEGLGALGQMLWWARDAEAEAPPDGKAKVVEFRPPAPLRLVERI